MDGTIKKWKAQFCAHGDCQLASVDFFEVFVPTVSWSTICMLLCLTIQHNWTTHQIDFTNAFVHAQLEEDVCISLPAHHHDESGIPSAELCLKLN